MRRTSGSPCEAARFFCMVLFTMKWRGFPRVVYLGLALSGLWGCAPSAAKSPSGGTDTDGQAKPASEEKVPLPPLEPAPAPAGVFFRARLSTPELAVDRALAAAGLPLRTKDLLSEADDGFLLLPLAELDLGGSIESIVMLNPVPERYPWAVASASVKSLESSLRALKRARVDAMEGPGGVYYFADATSQCALGRSIGPEAGRVVCAASSEALSALLPYALRGLPREALGGPTGWFELDVAPLREAYGQRAKGLRLLASVGARQLHIDHPRFDRALTEAAIALSDELGELVGDGDKVRGEFLQTERGDMQMRLGLRFRSMTSWVSGLVADWSGSMGPAPSALTDLPDTVSAAGAGVALPSSRKVKMRDILTDLGAGYLEAKKAKASDVKDAERVLRELFLREGAFVQATGPLEGAEPDPWTVYGTSRSKQDVTAFLDALGRLATSNILEKSSTELADLFELQRTTERPSGAPQAVVYRYKIGKSLSKLLMARPDVFDLSKDQERFAPEGRVAVHTVGNMTYLVQARTLASVGSGLAALQNPKGRLGAKADLAAHLKTPAVLRGFSRIEGVVVPFLPWMPETMRQKLVELVRATPNGGDVPMTYTVTAERRGEGSELQVNYDIPAAFTGDVAALIALALTDAK
jgi:hypothetical protein